MLLNGAPPLLRHRAIRDGVRLLDHRPAERIEFEVRTLNDYVDTEPLRRLLSRRLRGSIVEDRLVDAPSIESRLERLRVLLAELDEIRDGGRSAFDAVVTKLD